MSGFGGGFGGGSGFGSPNPSNNNPFGGGGFGSSSGNANAPGGFGNSSTTAGSTPFGGGSNVSNAPNPSFGGSTAAPSSFGNPNAGGGGMTFGASPNVLVAAPNRNGGGGFGGGGGNSAGFGTSFGSQQQNNASSSFGASFGTSTQSQKSPAPFEGSTSQPQQPSMTFGTSSNVFVNNNNTNQGFGGRGGSTTGSSFGGGGTGSGFGQFNGNSTKDEKIGASSSANPSSFNNKTNFNNSSNFPFGGGTTQSTPPFGDGATPAFEASSTFSAKRNEGNTMADNMNNNDTTRSAINSAQAEMEDKKRRLKAKIEEKKRQLLEKQKKKREEEAGRRSKSPTSMSAPTQSSRGTNERNPQSKPPTSQQSLAERNALRFAQHRNQPTVRSQSPVPTKTTSATKEREELKDAVNLVGLCRTMCPFDELERRRNESDIQALEVPLPGQLHPKDWTLEQTAIKRFRRSAADYKLDVPEWVRPPEVLERTMGYLEEWIMERDRQGPDPRFPKKDIPPPPLDVYQFIWDRTRMIRKDFILQNYVGTGGRCDAKAVRCHERIARWHAMCEHQLSHIDDFVNMQSQQNMQELGQTMKTLNSFYDDALNRSAKEIPDEKTGREKFVPDTNHTANATKDKNKSARGGCLFDTVQGQNPLDYNGHPLNNASDNPMITQRLVGENNNKTTARGTAEPEMRGIYMLLTMENEGGMEVLKYAAKLFKERPAVYHSPPVQLALTIFKAIKDMNYVKFFAILRSPSTPYLFACIMFKQVEIMRRIAIQIMSRTYGAQNKNGEAMYDQYPLERLAHILCFEDIKEAKEACEFYNITMKEYTSQRTGKTNLAILWKRSKFTIPKDPEKGHTLRLKPRKMMRTIESKLNGATRLAVCRGEVSGKGASLFDSTISSNLNPRAVPFVPPYVVSSEEEIQKLLLKKKLKQERLNQQAKELEEKERRAMEKRRILEERQKKALKKQQLIELEKLRQKELKEEEMQKQRIEEERAKRRKEEELARKIKMEKARKDAEEAARRQRELEERRKREEREKQMLQLERQIAQEKLRKELELKEKRRKEEEERRREILRLELEAKRKREAEERRKAKEWQSRIDSAAKVLMWHRWKRTLSRPLEMSVRSKKCLEEINPSFMTDSFDLVNIAKTIMLENRQRIQAPLKQRPTSKTVLEESLRQQPAKETSKIAIADMTLQEIESLSNNFVGHAGSRKALTLLKIALICPETVDVTDQSYASLLFHWIGTRVNVGKIEILRSDNTESFSLRHEVRTVVVRGSSYDVCSTCDIALVVIPPQWSNPAEKARLLNGVVSSLLDDDIPRVALALNDDIDGHQIQTINNVIAEEIGGSMDAIPIIQPSELSTAAFDNALTSAFHRIAKNFIREASVSAIRIPAMRLATKVVLGVLWQCVPSVVGEDVDEDTIVECSRLSLRYLVDELAKHLRRNKMKWSLWPAPEFSEGDIIESYFAENEGLPLQWMRSLGHEFLQETYLPLIAVFRGHFRDAYQRIVVDAPITVQDDCASECAQGHYRRCLEKALVWMQNDSASSGCFIYLPEGMVELVVKDVIARVQATLVSSRPADPVKTIPALAAEHGAIDNLVFPKPNEWNETFGGMRNKQRNSLNASVSPKLFGSNGSFLPVNKRSRSDNQIEDGLKKKRRENEDATNRILDMATTTNENVDATNEIPAVAPSHSRPNGRQQKNTVSASQSYTKKLERLLNGDETVEVTVGNTLLSRYLRDVPEPQVRPSN